mgnify:CR=1 FL=1
MYQLIPLSLGTEEGDHFRSPKLENVISVAIYAEISIEELLK